MKFAILSEFTIFSSPLSATMTKSLNYLSPFLVEVSNRKGVWSGIAVGANLITTQWLDREVKEIDVKFRNGNDASAFFVSGDGHMALFGCPHVPKQPALVGPQELSIGAGDYLFCLGNMLGVRFSVTRVRVKEVVDLTVYPSDLRLSLSDTYSTGSPIFDRNGAFQGILSCYVPKTETGIAVLFYCDNGIIRRLE